MEDDYISALPDVIIENILMRIPVCDAIKTSVLSRHWRYRWTKMTNLSFDDHLDPKIDRNFITNTLPVYDGIIHKFEVSVLQTSANINQWLVYLSRNGVKELVINLSGSDGWRIPSSLLNCQYLIHLELSRCEVHQRDTFTGFSFLKSLILRDVFLDLELTEVTIWACPVLETLEMLCYSSLYFYLHIDAPTLKYLTLGGQFANIVLLDTPLLLYVKVCMSSSDGDDYPNLLIEDGHSIFEKFLGAMPIVESLEGQNLFTKYLSTGHRLRRFPIILKYLKNIQLHGVSFEDMKQIQVVIHILVSSPALQTLIVSVSCDDSYIPEELELVKWDIKHILAHKKLEHLHQFQFTDMLANPNELRFVQFILEQSPLLETLKMTTSSSLKTEQKRILKDFLSSRRASTGAEFIILLDAETFVADTQAFGP
ncbi:hypothetical protein QQ045_019876 [Rhodiola kirilowii]